MGTVRVLRLALSRTKFTTCLLNIVFSSTATVSTHLSVYFQTLILEGAKVKLFPSNIALPSNSEPQQFVLLCIPDEPGHLALTGN